MRRFTHAIRATQGRRSYQEDAAAVWPGGVAAFPASLVSRLPVDANGALYAVLADGMGGHAGGALASSLACAAFVFNISRTTGDISNRLGEALHVANAAIGAKVVETPRLAGMGTTIIGVHIDQHGLSWTSVGDSPLLLHRDGVTRGINEDHSMAPVIDKLVADGKMTLEQGLRDGRRHMLRSALTGEALDLVDTTSHPLPLEAGDCIVLASDGLDTLADDEIGAVIERNMPDGPDKIAQALISAVEACGYPHQDNATVVVICVSA